MVNVAVQVAQELNPKVIIRVLLLSHGHANVGVTDTEMIAKQMAGLSERGISTSAFGLGNGFDEDLMELLPAARGHACFHRRSQATEDLYANELSGLPTPQRNASASASAHAMAMN